ncbi:MAG: hypothetical protein K2M64_04145 [Clostridia bacterium]|nr:hypothetical protein [Clostridia bacterium]
MNKTLRTLTLSTLSLFAVFVVFISFAHLYTRALGNSTYGWFEAIELYIPTIAGLAASILTIPTVIFVYRTTLPKHRKLFFTLSLAFFCALCITFIGNMLAYRIFFLHDNHSNYDIYIHSIVRPKIVTAFVLLFLILSIVSVVLFFTIKTLSPRRPTKTEQMQAQIDELQKQVDELKTKDDK